MTSPNFSTLSSSAVDQLGVRLRAGLTVDDLRLLDQYRREFRDEYDVVVERIRTTLKLDI
jgi:hypothetical protein